jgi:fermentation-respiration switch protein FrsA (DUF1100 family)
LTKYLLFGLLVLLGAGLLVSRYRKGGAKRMLISIVTVLLVAYWGLGLILYFMQPTFLYRPTPDVLYTPDELGLAFENVVITTRDGLKLSGWYVPAEDAQLTLLFCHGNGGNITHRLDSINIFHDLGINCLIFDYRGYGNSEGKPTEEGTYLDAKAAYQWLRKNKKTDANNIIIFGRSLGASIAAQLASQVEARGLIIESGFTSYADMGKKFYPYMPVRWFASFSYNTVGYLRQVRCPVLVVHSRTDELVPFQFGLELYETANEPKEFVEITGSHNDGFLISGQIYTNNLREWLKFVRKYQPQAQPVLRRIS